MEIVKRDRYFALYDQGELVCIAVYKKGAQEVKRRIEELKAVVERSKNSTNGNMTTEIKSAD